MKQKSAQKHSVLVLAAPACCVQLDQTLTSPLLSDKFDFSIASKLPQDLSVSPEILLLDYGLRNALDICRKAAASPQFAQTPVLMLMPPDSPTGLHIQALQAGADMLLELSPDSPQELAVKLRHLLALGRRRSAQEERARLEWLTEEAEDAILLLDGEQNILYANPKAKIYLEHSSGSERMEGKNFLSVCKEQYHLETAEAWQLWPAPAPEGVKRYLVRPETQNSRAFWLEVSALPSPNSPGSLLRLKNVTKQVTFFRNMQSFNVLVSHKLRTPVNQILLSAQLAETAQAQPDLDKFHKLIIDGAQKMRDQVEQILAYISEDAVARPVAPFGVKNVKALAESVAENFNISNFSIEIDKKAEEAHLNMNRAALELILDELFRNAVKHHPTRSPEIRISVMKRDSSALIAVSDDGQNLGPDQLEQAFTPYWQGEKFFTGQQDGMGLGLSLVRILVRECGGQCRFCNNAGRSGIRVEIAIPLLAQ